jgi:hypothetical protein
MHRKLQNSKTSTLLVYPDHSIQDTVRARPIRHAVVWPLLPSVPVFGNL